jgi:hypothetical protein
MTKNQKLAKEAIKLAEKEIKEWTKFLSDLKERYARPKKNQKGSKRNRGKLA